MGQGLRPSGHPGPIATEPRRLFDAALGSETAAREGRLRPRPGHASRTRRVGRLGHAGPKNAPRHLSRRHALDAARGLHRQQRRLVLGGDMQAWGRLAAGRRRSLAGLSVQAVGGGPKADRRDPGVFSAALRPRHPSYRRRPDERVGHKKRRRVVDEGRSRGDRHSGNFRCRWKATRFCSLRGGGPRLDAHEAASAGCLRRRGRNDGRPRRLA